jgi:hypothetical protein
MFASLMRIPDARVLDNKDFIIYPICFKLVLAVFYNPCNGNISETGTE